MTPNETYDLAIVGGGPAGMAAAVAANRYGMKACVIDEQPRLGGQIYRQPPLEFRVSSWLAGAAYDRGKALIRSAESLAGLRHIAPATVWACLKSREGIEAHDLLFYGDQNAGRVTATRVLIAAGCYEAPVAFPGWQLPGVMSAGGIQTLMKSQRVAAGREVVLAGSHPLLIVVAEQLLAAGVKIAAVVFAQPFSAASTMMRSLGTAATGARQILSAAITLTALRRAGVPVLFGHAVIEAQGAGVLESVRVRPLSGGAAREIRCDALGVCYGFLASSELARQAGARHHWVPQGGWVIQTDHYLRTSVPGILVAGELLGVAGAEAAAVSGEIAAMGAAVDLGRIGAAQVAAPLHRLQRRLARLQRFAALLTRLSTLKSEWLEGLALPSTLVCRCEDITHAELEDAVRADCGIVSASTAKLQTRVGMGLCQGRMCEISVRRIIARQRNVPLERVEGYVARPPIKPIPIALLADFPDALAIDPDSLAASGGSTDQ